MNLKLYDHKYTTRLLTKRCFGPVTHDRWQSLSLVTPVHTHLFQIFFHVSYHVLFGLATRQKWSHPAVTQPYSLVPDLPTPEGWELA